MNTNASKCFSEIPYINMSQGLDVLVEDIHNMTYVSFYHVKGLDGTGIKYALIHCADVFETYAKSKGVKISRITDTKLSFLTKDYEKLFV